MCDTGQLDWVTPILLPKVFEPYSQGRPIGLSLWIIISILSFLINHLKPGDEFIVTSAIDSRCVTLGLSLSTSIVLGLILTNWTHLVIFGN